MDTRLRTKILYEDPNSIFKSGKKVYLHELQGATLKTTKPTPDDITIGLKGAESMSMLINQLSQLQNIIEYFYTNLLQVAWVDNNFSKVSMRDGTKLIGLIITNMNKLSKLKNSVFNEDDIFTLLSYYDDIVIKMQEMQNYGLDVNNVFIDDFYESPTFKLFFTKIAKTLIPKFHAFLQLINVSGISNMGSTLNLNSLIPFDLPGYADAVEPPDEPLDIPPAEPLEGAGRFKVLSNRIRKQQPMAFKRFL